MNSLSIVSALIFASTNKSNFSNELISLSSKAKVFSLFLSMEYSLTALKSELILSPCLLAAAPFSFSIVLSILLGLPRY